MTMPILHLQQRARELGRIRLGQKGDKGQPQKLDRFRLTSASEPLLTRVAELYGGEVQPWTPKGGSPQFEVVTNTNRLPIMVPPQPVTQWHEAWRASGCVHRCNGEVNALTDEFCDPEDPLHQEALSKPTTRLNVVLRDVEGIGVWRVETHGWHAAVELPDVAEFLARAGGYVNGWLALEQRTSVDNSGSKPVTRHFMVPIIEIDITPAELMAGRGAVVAIDAGRAPAAIEAGPTGEVADEIVDAIADVGSLGDLRDLWTTLGRQGRLTASVKQRLESRAAEFAPAPEDATPAEAVPVHEGEPEPNPDDVWREIVTAGGKNGLSLSQITDDFAQWSGGVLAEDANGFQLADYLAEITREGNAA